jgi:hypothetical protein
VRRRVTASSPEGGSAVTPARSRSSGGGEGGSKLENGGGLVSPTVEGENGDGGDQKRVGDCGGSVTGMDEMCSRLAVGGGER